MNVGIASQCSSARDCRQSAGLLKTHPTSKVEATFPVHYDYASYDFSTVVWRELTSGVSVFPSELTTTILRNCSFRRFAVRHCYLRCMIAIIRFVSRLTAQCPK